MSTQDFTIVNDERWIRIGNSTGNEAKSISVAAILRAMPEHRERRYSGSYIDCLIPKNAEVFAVSLAGEQCSKHLNSIPVVNHKQRTKQYAVCVTPLNYKYSNVHQLVEMIEFNKILGAELFIFYNYSTNSNVDKILKYYRQQGLVEIIQWHIPVKVDTWPQKSKPEIHYFGQLPALNDCLHRNAQRSTYVVFQDLDEFIIPRKGYYWNDMMKKLPTDKNAYIFRNAFFRKDWPDNNLTFIRKELAIKYKSTTLLKSRRERKILEHLRRSKYIVKPKTIDTVGIHNIYRYKDGKSSVHNVEAEYGLLHHYRDWENPKDYHTGTNDPYTLQYSNELSRSSCLSK
ncbi:hypothetical protein KUTeg_019077 [Tegillarca granosa]|uniref:Glycosyltransferase family 92 protein n=1 Tax=Tegillarca granosa TaxID=220873 RepID=A0ABQ9EFQ8_TEGGR|nr:hypothetical protein KUTeg_019077 [Tegillarca granosa]